ncbi:MAG: SRPBCC family protein [Sandaracinus sp.]|nr:SRPBCC family protein [Sandaracinus sp.]
MAKPYRVERSRVVRAAPSVVFELVAKLREWPKWSPWEGLDPALERKRSEERPPSKEGAGELGRSLPRSRRQPTRNQPMAARAVSTEMSPFFTRSRNAISKVCIP